MPQHAGSADGIGSAFADYFSLWTAVLAAVALSNPWLFTWVSPPIGRALMVSLVFLMGTTAHPEDFKAGFLKVRPLSVNFFVCFAVLPAVALLISHVLDLDQDFTVGMVLMGGVNGGSASNLFALLAGGDVALSVLMTITTTLGAVICTPLVAEVYLGAIVPVDTLGMLRSAVEIVLIPIICGVLVRAALPMTVSKLEPLVPTLGLGFALVLIGGVLAGNAESILSAGIWLHLAAVTFHAIAGLLGYFLAALSGSDERERRTVAIEIAMKNHLFACMLAVAHFESAAVQIPPATACIWCPMIAAGMAAYWKAQLPGASWARLLDVAECAETFGLLPRGQLTEATWRSVLAPPREAARRLADAKAQEARKALDRLAPLQQPHSDATP
ncbi:BASS1 [Symbiodinium natans]|uniref:BASS1 protein n=1 Tax=Symbiodinium natans TaxID=878477 RepID=A0A812JMP2_9DINO|nr:BASS1 [Symbiodinium natans]